MAPRLLLADAESAADLITFAGRAARLGDGAVRLSATAGVLSMTAAPLAPRGLLDATPTVLGMRVLRADPELACDLVVDATRLVRASDDLTAVELPDTALSPAWAGVSAPRGGWERAGDLRAGVLAQVAREGFAAVTQAAPVDAGEDVVRGIRARVWGAPDARLADLPAGAAFAAFGLGFTGDDDEEVRVFRAGVWTRLSLARGHTLVRTASRSGLTPVRATGAAPQS